MSQNLVSTILEAIYEPVFHKFSYGFRRRLNTHKCIGKLYQDINERAENCSIVEIDIEKFFNTVDHKKLVELLKIKTNNKKLNNCIQDFKVWIKRARNQMKLSKLWEIASVKLRGHYNYFGVTFNSSKVNYYYYSCVRLMFKWLNRRSQKKSFTWEQFCNRLKHEPLPKPPLGFELKRITGQKWNHTLKIRMRENRKYGSERNSGANPVFT